MKIGSLFLFSFLLGCSPANVKSMNRSGTIENPDDSNSPEDNDKNIPAKNKNNSKDGIPPTISAIADQSIDEDASTGSLNFRITDASQALNCISSVSLKSSNELLVPLASITLAGTSPRLYCVSNAS